MTDLHAALKTEVVGRANTAAAEFILVRLQDSKISERWSLHARPGSYTTAGWQSTDVLGTLGFHHSRCSFVVGDQCYVRAVPRDFSAELFAPAFDMAARNLTEAVRHLEACGLGLEQPEGWTFFTGRSRERGRRGAFEASGDGHTSPERRELKRVAAVSFQYDVAISFAGSQRAFAEHIAKRVRDAGYRVFYDNFYPEALWGKDLAVFFDNVFRKESRFCLVLISKEYLERPWTEHERRSALARMIAERGGEYLLPVQIDPVELPGLAPTIGYLSAERFTADQIADLLIAKLRKSQ